MKSNWRTSGVVDSIDMANRTITLWLSDFDDLQTVPITPDMPVWLMIPEKHFSCRIPRESIRKDSRWIGSLNGIAPEGFETDEFGDMVEKELLDRLALILH